MIEPIIAEAAKANPERPGDYRKDGLLYCGKCKTQKEYRLPGVTVRCMCSCEAAKYEEEEAEKQERQRQAYIDRLRRDSQCDPAATFANADNTPTLDKCRRYVTAWPKMYADNIGLLLWGNTGNGKTFAAACIANALIDQSVSVLLTSFPRILANITGLFADDRAEYIDSLSSYKLLVIDDLGAERQSEYSLEQVYSVIDIRYQSKKPLIVTTNLPLEEIKNPKNMEYQRIYDRILEMCVPIHFAGESIRKSAHAKKVKMVRELFEEG
jgi:DNA replication protein DnaC